DTRITPIPPRPGAVAIATIGEELDMVRSIKEAEQNRIVMEATDGSGLELRPVQVVEIRAFMGEWPRLLRIRQSGNQAIRQSGNQATIGITWQSSRPLKKRWAVSSPRLWPVVCAWVLNGC